MTIDEMIAVLQAAKAGKAEWRYKKSSGWSPWGGPESCELNTRDFDYRVKPEPRELWLQDCQGSKLWQEKWPGVGIHFREVL